MKIIFLVNSPSKTSIPLRWSQFFNTNSNQVHVDFMPLNVFLKKINSLKNDCHLVHGHHIKSMFIFLMINIFLKKKSVFTVHGSYLFLSVFNKRLISYIFKKTDKIIFVNKTLYDVLPNNLKKVIESKYEIFLNGVESNYKFEKTDVYSKFNINANDKILFHPARFVEEKNHLRTIEAFKSIADNNPNVKMVLAGDGKLKTEIEAKILELNLSDKIARIGLINRDEVYCFLEKCEIFLMPSVSEGLNVSFLEALSMNCKIIVSNIDQFVYPLQKYNLKNDDLNITFVDPFRIDSIKEGIQGSLNKAKINNCDASDFSLEKMMKSYIEIYKTI